MANFIVHGGKLLSGEIVVSGSKNATLPVLAAQLLFQNKIAFKNIPAIEDVLRMQELMNALDQHNTLDFALIKRLRGSVLAIGPLVARLQSVSFPHPGGCKIGARPIDVFIQGWEAMGAHVFTPPQAERGVGFYRVEAPNGFHGCDYAFRVKSVTGTESLMMTAVLAEGTTLLRNAAEEPEVVVLADFLNDNGADIRGAGTSEIIITGRSGKLLKGTNPFVAPPDRMEAGSLIIAGALLGDSLTIKGCVPEEKKALFAVLERAGVFCEIGPDFVVVKRPLKLNPFHVRTEEYPGFPTDLQAPITALATQADGESLIEEMIFESRLAYAADLNRMGANIMIHGPRRATVVGKTMLKGAHLMSPDIRAGLAFIFAALLADGESVIGEVYQVDRGYERIDERLRMLGADIQRV